MVETTNASVRPLHLDLTETEIWFPDNKNQGKCLEDEYILGHVIGRGTCSTVYKCLLKGRTERACKIYSKGRLNKKMVQSEIAGLLKLRHSNIIQVKEIFETPTELKVISEMVSGEELFNRLVEQGHYSERDAAVAVRQILSALEYLHSQGVVHRDVKPENLLYETENENARLKLADFSLTKAPKNNIFPSDTVCGTLGYCAPEILQQKDYNTPADMWSLGVVTYIMLCGFEPFWDDGGGESELYRRITEGDYEFPSPWWDDVSDDAKDVLSRLLIVDSDKRLTATEALKHSWVKGEKTRTHHLHKTVTKLREFNARKKFKAATHVVLATHRAKYLISPERKMNKTCSNISTI